ncbi:MAG: SPOR domain-containing protein [Burkholderiales bacterium]|nr:MAG: SPOR domain-containing protein [Burkholderiales bacterium]
MLRWTIVVLALANLLYFGWTQGLIGDFQRDQREPERLQTQLHPETLRLLKDGEEPPAPAVQAENPAPAPQEQVTLPVPDPQPLPEAEPAAQTRCWQAGGFSAVQADALRVALQGSGLPADTWRLEEVRLGGRWIVYMGPYSAGQAADKKSELRQTGIDFRDVRIAEGPGLALGTFPSEELARQGLQDLSRKGVRTARVEQERGETTSFTLLLPALTEVQLATVSGLGALGGRTLQACE